MTVEVIAECGVNADGDLGKAYALIDAAIEAGADTVKWQATYPRHEMSSLLMSERIEDTERAILSHAQLEEVAAHCAARNIEFLCTPSEDRSLHWLIHTIRPKRIKIGSDNLTNHPFLKFVASYGLRVILSTGMSTMDEISKAWRALIDNGVSGITLLHCTTCYPCAAKDANLYAIQAMQERFEQTGTRIGWSDHTLSTTLAGIAVALGAEVLEKHITLNRNAQGPDHAASLEPSQFAEMVRVVREAERALGDGNKVPLACEQENRKMLRKSLIAKEDIAAGDRYTPHNLGIMRPGTGASPDRYQEFLGRKAARAFESGEPII